MANSTGSPIALPTRLPRYVQNLAALAESCGLTTSPKIEPCSNDPELRLWLVCTGTRESTLAFIKPIASWHVPLTRGSIWIPGGSKSGHAIANGGLTVRGEYLELELDAGPGEYSIEERRGVEALRTPCALIYHGSAAQLVEAGIDPKRLPLGKRPLINGPRHIWDSSREQLLYFPNRKAVRQFDGSIVYTEETVAAFERRMLKQGLEAAESKAPRPSHLRLVVDNTRELSHAAQ